MKSYNFIIVSDYKGGELAHWEFGLTLEEALDSLYECIVERLDEDEPNMEFQEFKELVEEMYDQDAGFSGSAYYIVDNSYNIDLGEEEISYLYNKYVENE